jgi:glucosyl-3-phosphoglycerate synthase
MSDFTQNGVICTLPRLNETHLEPLDTLRLPALSRECPVSLILPCHAPDLERPALRHICEQLAGARWLERVLLPVNDLPLADLPALWRRLSPLIPGKVTVFSTDEPALRSLLGGASGRQAGLLPPGKGLNVWAALGILHAARVPGVYALQDADVLSFQRSTLARLCLSVAEPTLGFDFAKMYYSRVTDRLYGRVSRLFFAPLLLSLIHVAGHHPLLDFLQSFRYPLSGECAFRASLASSLPVWEGWSLEVGMLTEVFRRLEPERVCQVDGGTGYDHKHQPAQTGLHPMCLQIAETLLHQLATEGCRVDASFRQTLQRAQTRHALEAARRSAALAFLNAIPCNLEEEREAAQGFASTLRAGEPDHASRNPAPLPSWDSVEKIRPELIPPLARFLERSV